MLSGVRDEHLAQCRVVVDNEITMISSLLPVCSNICILFIEFVCGLFVCNLAVVTVRESCRRCGRSIDIINDMISHIAHCLTVAHAYILKPQRAPTRISIVARCRDRSDVGFVFFVEKRTLIAPSAQLSLEHRRRRDYKPHTLNNNHTRRTYVLHPTTTAV